MIKITIFEDAEQQIYIDFFMRKYLLWFDCNSDYCMLRLNNLDVAFSNGLVKPIII
jgi:hypothetical protein